MKSIFIAVIIRTDLDPIQIRPVIADDHETEIKTWHSYESAAEDLSDHRAFNHYDGRILEIENV
jgi:hypothetical protein